MDDGVIEGLDALLRNINNRLDQKRAKLFTSLNTDRERLAFVWDMFDLRDIAPHQGTGKSAAMSTKYRETGNVLFKKKCFSDALLCFNASVTSAPVTVDLENMPQSDWAKRIAGLSISEDDPKTVECCVKTPNVELAMAHGNRSAALYFMKEYQEALDDIEIALEQGFPKETHYKLYERQAKCHAKLGHSDAVVASFDKAIESLATSGLEGPAQVKLIDSWKKQGVSERARQQKGNVKPPKENLTTNIFKAPKISYGEHDKYEGASNVLDVVYNDSRGRCVVAKQDIDVGDIMISEAPYRSILYERFYESHCHHCTKPVPVNLSCPTCGHVVYCSKKCQQQSWNEYHNIECPIIQYFSQKWVGNFGHLSLRMALTTGYETICEAQRSPRDAKTAKMTDGKYSNNYKTLMQLEGHSDKRSVNDNLQFTIVAAFMLKVLQQSLAKPEDCTRMNEPLTILGEAILEHLRIVQCNAFSISEMQRNEDFNKCHPQDIGLGLYAFSSLVNHSCDPIMDVSYYGNVCVHRVLRNVKAGEEITEDYGPQFMLQLLHKRQEVLQSQYYFKCKCIACENNWPLSEELESENARFLCLCGAILPETNIMTDPCITCTSCQVTTDLVCVVRQLSNSQENFKDGMVLCARADYKNALPLLQAHLTLVQRRIAPPWRDFYSCQAAIKQCYRLLASGSLLLAMEEE